MAFGFVPLKHRPHFDFQRNTDEKYNILDVEMQAAHYFQDTRSILSMAWPGLAGLVPAHWLALSPWLGRPPTWFLFITHHLFINHRSSFSCLSCPDLFLVIFQITAVNNSSSGKPILISGLGQPPPHRSIKFCVLLYHNICPRYGFMVVGGIIWWILLCPTWSWTWSTFSCVWFCSPSYPQCL